MSDIKNSCSPFLVALQMHWLTVRPLSNKLGLIWAGRELRAAVWISTEAGCRRLSSKRSTVNTSAAVRIVR